MVDVPVLVVRTGGINCDEEVMYCWKLAGARPKLVHLNALSERPAMLEEFAVITIPGGFSYGDDIAAGVVFAQRIVTDLAEHLQRFVDRGGGLLGICNGFQILVKAGLLPGGDVPRGRVTITFNDSARFEARWVKMEVCSDRCPFLKMGTHLEMPVEHAEGKVITSDEAVARGLEEHRLIALRYVDSDGLHDRYPANPNGSTRGIAGLCDETGRIFGLMPHPDRHFDHMHHPLWTRQTSTRPPDGLSVFQNAVAFWSR